jgi:hypothetical protein
MAGRDITHVVKINHTDLNATAALIKSLAILPTSMIKNGVRVRCIGINVTVPFVGVTTLTLQIGETDTDRFFTATDVKAKAFTAASSAITTQPFAFNVADTVDALFTATVDNLTLLSAGEVIVLLNVSDDSVVLI